jgi:hypothetical protein
MKAAEKIIGKNTDKKSIFTLKALILMILTIFFCVSMGLSLLSHVTGARRALNSNKEIQEKYKKVQAEVAEQNKLLVAVKSAEGIEKKGREKGMVKAGEQSVQIQFAPETNPVKEEQGSNPTLFTTFNILIALIVMAFAITVFIYRKKIMRLRVSSPVPEPDGDYKGLSGRTGRAS